MDFSALNDEELADHLNQVLAEQERRKALAEIPEQIRELTAKYVAGGGQAEDLQTEQPVAE
ncbi:UDP:flavonoid glycosyltransferase YjiC (YdhE family) [Arthrobacter sp. JUb119]|nr:UDP:flavonoid glycosyltransferase YjiC (YdhE family) [Arthrobacter sp. JUb119]